MEDIIVQGFGNTEPISVGAGHKDFLFSAVLSCLDSGIYSADAVVRSASSFSDVYFADIHIYFRRGGVAGVGVGDYLCARPLYLLRGGDLDLVGGQFDDVVVRCFYCGDKIVDIAWVSLYRGGEKVFSF